MSIEAVLFAGVLVPRPSSYVPSYTSNFLNLLRTRGNEDNFFFAFFFSIVFSVLNFFASCTVRFLVERHFRT